MISTTRNQLLGNVRRAVIKVGRSLLAELPVARIRALAMEVALLREGGLEVVIVSSGAIEFGMAALDLKRRPRQMPLLQAASAVGQVELMQTFQDAMSAHRIPVAQTLLAHQDLDQPAGFLLARHTLLALLDYGVVPVVNENDSVAVREIIDSDNDMLAARVPRLVEADLLVMLTTAEGISQRGSVIPVVEDISALARRVADSPSRRGAQRSLASKVRAAELAAAQGVATVVASGVRIGVLSNILDDDTLGTVVMPSKVRRSRKKWIAEDLDPSGTLTVSTKVHESLMRGNHSLPASGVLGSEGTFSQGEAVRVVDADGAEFARGLVGYSVEELSRIQGKPPENIEKLLGYKHYEEVIHRDDLVIL